MQPLDVLIPVQREAQPQAPQSSGSDGSPDHQSLPDSEAVRHLAALSPIEYDRRRESEAERLGVRLTTLDRLVRDARHVDANPGVAVNDIEPWPDPVDPQMLLTDISNTVRRFLICETETADAVALWIAMSWLIDAVQVAPLAVITSPEKRCGKSQMLTLMGKLVCRPIIASNISPAALFRAIDAWQPTLLVDEADAFMHENEELRGILNCGHTRDTAYVVRVVGDEHTPTKFHVWGAKALAGIGRLADTLMDRAIILPLRRKLPHEQVDRLRYAEPGLFAELAAKLARLAEDYREAIRHARPELPAELNDRAQDNWEPLLAIAEVAGGPWPGRAKAAALKLSGSDDGLSLGAELLSDIQEVFRAKGVERIASADLINALCEDGEAPWLTYNRGKPITQRQVASKLRDYGIRPRTIRLGVDTAKGYLREWFEEAFTRYLPTLLSSVTPSQPSNGEGFAVTHAEPCDVTTPRSVARKPAESGACYAVTDHKGGKELGIGAPWKVNI